MTNYIQQAQNFATKFNVKLSFIGDPEYRGYFSDDKEERYVFKCKLQRNKLSYTFTFGQSISAGAQEPTLYDILTSLTKYDPETFEDFCSNYGYDQDSRKAEKTYKAVCKEWNAVSRLFADLTELQWDELREIN